MRRERISLPIDINTRVPSFFINQSELSIGRPNVSSSNQRWSSCSTFYLCSVSCCSLRHSVHLSIRRRSRISCNRPIRALVFPVSTALFSAFNRLELKARMTTTMLQQQQQCEVSSIITLCSTSALKNVAASEENSLGNLSFHRHMTSAWSWNKWLSHKDAAFFQTRSTFNVNEAEHCVSE